MIFKNLKEAHTFYNYPSSHRFGTIGDNNGALRSYSNGKGCDYYKKNGKEIFYKIKNIRVRNLFSINLDSGQKVRFFKKVKDGVEDMGLYNVLKFTKDNFVKLIK